MSSTNYSQRYVGDVSPSYLENAREHFTSIEYLPKVLYKNASRYKNLRTIQDVYSGKIHHESYIQQAIQRSIQQKINSLLYHQMNKID